MTPAASTAGSRPLVIGVPRLEQYRLDSGIGRVLTSLAQAWGDRARVVPVSVLTSRVPLLRNLRVKIDARPGIDVLLLPQITGAEALGGVGVPTAVVVHDVGIVDFPGDRPGMDWITRRLVTRSFHSLHHASVLICVSQFTARRLAEHLPGTADRIVVIPNGVDGRLLNYREPRRSAVNALEVVAGRELRRPLLLYVGSELPRKNVPVLLEALARVRDVHRGAQLLKVGSAGHPRFRAETLRQAARLGLRAATDLVFLDDLDDLSLARAYRAADLYVTASLYEGFGLPVLEAMAIGTPVVASRRGAHPEVVGQHGWLVEPDAAELGESILTALGAERGRPRIGAARRRAASLTWTRSAEAYLRVLRGIAA